MMLTDRGIGLAGGAAAMWLASRTFGVPELQIAALASIALLALAVLVTRLGSASLEVERSIRPGRLFHDAEAHIDLVIHNRSRLPTPLLELQDEAPPALASRGAQLRLGVMPPLATRTMAYRLRGHRRGRFAVGPLTTRLRDPFGLVARRVRLPETSELVVYPRVWILPEGVPLGGADSGGAGRTRPLPSGEDLAHVREYVRGDDLRKVHWPSTAHRGKLMVRQPEAPRDPRATVLLDAREQVHRGVGAASSLETAISAAASVIHHLALNGRSVSLVDGPLTVVPPVRAWESQLAHLAELSARRGEVIPTLRQLGRGAAGDGLLVAIMPVPEPVELRELVRAGRAFSTRLALLVDVHGHTGRPRGHVVGTAEADALRTAGWRVAVLGAHDRLDERWQDLVLRPSRMTGGITR